MSPSLAGLPLAVLNLIPKSSSGPPGLWLHEQTDSIRDEEVRAEEKQSPVVFLKQDSD